MRDALINLLIGATLGVLAFVSLIMILICLMFPEVWLLAVLTLPIAWAALIRAIHKRVFMR